jgi:putative endonuclease
MNYFVYILYSESLDVYYKGFTTNIENRLDSHLLGQSDFTSRATDWEFAFLILSLFLYTFIQ